MIGLVGYTLGRASTPETTSMSTMTTVPAALFVGQGRAWVNAHGEDLTLISTWAKNLADAAKVNNSRLAALAAQEMLIQVGRADGDLPANAFGAAMHQVFTEYVTALNEIHAGLVKSDVATYRAGSQALAHAVQSFSALTARLKVTP